MKLKQKLRKIEKTKPSAIGGKMFIGQAFAAGRNINKVIHEKNGDLRTAYQKLQSSKGNKFDLRIEYITLCTTYGIAINKNFILDMLVGVVTSDEVGNNMLLGLMCEEVKTTFS